MGSDELSRRGIAAPTDVARAAPGISPGAGETSWQGNNLDETIQRVAVCVPNASELTDLHGHYHNLLRQ